MIVSVKLPPEFAKKALSVKQRKHSHFLIGEQGEQLAKDFLVQNGLTIVGQNIRWKRYEVDIIAYDQTTQQLVLVEVKTRRSDLVEPHKAITNKKVHSLTKFAQVFIKFHYRHFKIYLNYRIDAVCILHNSVKHFQNISWW